MKYPGILTPCQGIVAPDVRDRTTPVVERIDDAARDALAWDPVIRLFIGGPLDGRALEGADSREYETGPLDATTDYWHGCFLYTPRGLNDDGWHIYRLNAAETLRQAKARYVRGTITLDEFEQAVTWALAVENQ